MRVGLVLGGGGVTGLAYHAAALAAIEHDLGWDPRAADVVVGTSAGSIVAAMLRRGVPASDLSTIAVGGDPTATPAGIVRALRDRPDLPPVRLSALVGRPPRLPSLDLLGAWVRRPWRLDPVNVVASVIPDGTLDLVEHASGLDEILGSRWPDEPTWICAVRQTRPAPRRARPRRRVSAGAGGRRLVLDPGLLPAGRHRRGELRRRRGPLPHQRRRPAHVARARRRHRRVADVRPAAQPLRRPLARAPPRPRPARRRAQAARGGRHPGRGDRARARGDRRPRHRLHERCRSEGHRGRHVPRHRRPAAHPAAQDLLGGLVDRSRGEAEAPGRRRRARRPPRRPRRRPAV